MIDPKGNLVKQNTSKATEIKIPKILDKSKNKSLPFMSNIKPTVMTNAHINQPLSNGNQQNQTSTYTPISTISSQGHDSDNDQNNTILENWYQNQ